MKDNGQRAVQFINALTHTKGKWAGQPFSLRTWQADFISKLFGTLNDRGLRQYRKALLYLPRKNGKTELAAAIALYLLFAEGEPGAEIYSAAGDRDQAALVFNIAAGMVRNEPELEQCCKIIDSQKRIVRADNGSFYRAISSEAGTKHGYNASAIIADEVHVWPNRDLWEALTTSTGARQQPLTLAITTAGYDKHSLAFELFDYACKVRDGIVTDPAFLPLLYYAADDADWTDETTWHQCNPALGDFRSLEEMRMQCAEAQEIPTRENAFRRLYLNQWTEADVRWLPMDRWDLGDQPLPDLQGCECWGGLDLSTTTDLSVLVLAFPIDGCMYLLPYFWCPGESAKRREHRDRVPYTTWIKQGQMRATAGDVVDYDVIRRDINELGEQYNIQGICIDRWNASHIMTQLAGDGFNILQFGQGYASMSAPSKDFERLLLDGKLLHAGQPVLRWNASNVTIEQDAAGNIKPSKKKSTERIDGIVAAIMACANAIHVEPEQSVYATRGILTLDY